MCIEYSYNSNSMRTATGKNSPYTFYSKGAKRFRKLERQAPNKIPPYTCPSIDKTIEQLNSLTKQLEKLRKQNSKLRDAADFWKNMAEVLCEEFLD